MCFFFCFVLVFFHKIPFYYRRFNRICHTCANSVVLLAYFLLLKLNFWLYRLFSNSFQWHWCITSVCCNQSFIGFCCCFCFCFVYSMSSRIVASTQSSLMLSWLPPSILWNRFCLGHLSDVKPCVSSSVSLCYIGILFSSCSLRVLFSEQYVFLLFHVSSLPNTVQCSLLRWITR